MTLTNGRSLTERQVEACRGRPRDELQSGKKKPIYVVWKMVAGQLSARFAQRVFMAFLLIGYCHSAGMAAGTLHLQTYDIIDPQMGIPAFRVLAPQDWQLRGGLTWSAALANLVTADVAITAPDNSAGFYIHPSPMYISGQIESPVVGRAALSRYDRHANSEQSDRVSATAAVAATTAQCSQSSLG